jgi:hypothetical protein
MRERRKKSTRTSSTDPGRIDDLDWVLLESLQEDARLSFRVAIPAYAVVYRRVRDESAE